MTPPPSTEDPFSHLERSFHEPKRLALVSALLGTPGLSMTFTELKEACELTDGNLNRHLKVLEEAGVVAIGKTKGTGRPTTHVSLTPSGQADFLHYLTSLEAVLKKASEAVRKAERGAARKSTGIAGARAHA